MKNIKEIIQMNIDDFEITNRTLNILNYLNVKTVKDLIQYTKKDLLSVPGAGLKTYQEIDELLKYISPNHFNKIYLGMDLKSIDNQSLPIEKENELELNFIKKNLNKLLIPIEKIDFSVRTSNALKNERINCVGDLIVLSESYLLKLNNFGRISIDEVIKFLKTLSLSLDMKLDNWPLENHQELLRNFNYNPITTYDLETIKKIINEKLNEREKFVFEKRFGKGHTLDRIGKQIHVTRERVRQIEAKMFRKLLRFKDLFKKFLSHERIYIFKKLSKNSNYITFETVKDFKNLNNLLSIEKDVLINYSILLAYKNYSHFLDSEFYETSKSNFILRTRGNNSRVKHEKAWVINNYKNLDKNKNRIIKSGVLKLT